MNGGLHTQVQGEGPRLVLLHGWSLNLRVWDQIVPALAQHFQVIRIDLPGHGLSAWRSEARTLRGQAHLVRDALLSLERQDPARAARGYSLLGWSLGGQIALELAVSDELVLEALILVSTTPRFVAGADWPYGMAPAVLQRFAEQLTVDFRQTIRDFLELQVRGSTGGPAVLKMLQSALLAQGGPTRDALEAGLHVLADTDLRPRLSGLRERALVVAGQYDRVAPPEASRALAASLARAEYFELRRAGHAPFLSHGEGFARRVTMFLLDEPAATDEPVSHHARA